MKADAFEAGQRSREYFHGLRVLPGAWTVIRVDGRGFSRLTQERFEKPFDPRFAELMVTTAAALLTEFGGRYSYTESDEISLLLDRDSTLFGRGVEKLVSLAAGLASATFTHAAGTPAHFDGRLWVGTTDEDVTDYFSWRQSDATRCALNGWCYWTLRNAGSTAQQATAALEGTSTPEKHNLLYAHGVNFTDVPPWQRRGIGIHFRPTGPHLPFVDRDLPMKDEYRALVTSLLAR